MKHVLLRTAAAVALLAAPTMAFAQDQDRGDRQEMSRGAKSERMDASGDAESKLDDASKPRGGDRADRMDRDRADSAMAQDVRGDRGKEDDSRRAEDRRDRAAMDDRGDRSGKDRDDKTRVSDERGGKDRDARRDRADRDDASVSAKVKISDKDGKDRRDRDRDGKRADRDRDSLDVKVKVGDRDRRGYDDDYGRSRTKTTVSSRDDVDVERRKVRSASSDVDVEQRRSIRQRFAGADAGLRVARSTFEGSEMSVGASVPRTIAVRRVPATVIEAEPTYTTYSYFETDDERIVIVDPDSHRVVRVIED